MKKRVRHGFTFRDPKGMLDYRICDSEEAAQTNAAFARPRGYSHIEMPGDWYRALREGYRIVPVKLKVKKKEK